MQVLLVGLFVAAVSASDVSLQEFVLSNTQFSASVYKVSGFVWKSPKTLTF
jgi:hypothetical protein